MSRYIILDLDNCIADDEWRLPMIRWQHPNVFMRFHDYHSLAAFDRVHNEHLFRERSELILILTSRPVFYRAATEEWLRRNHVPFKYLLMRNNDDHRPSPALKAAQLLWLPEYDVTLEQIVAAYDDRAPIVEYYRSVGLKAERHFIHEKFPEHSGV